MQFIFGLLHFLESENKTFKLWIKASIFYKILCNKRIFARLLGIYNGRLLSDTNIGERSISYSLYSIRREGPTPLHLCLTIISPHQTLHTFSSKFGTQFTSVKATLLSHVHLSIWWKFKCDGSVKLLKWKIQNFTTELWISNKLNLLEISSGLIEKECEVI
jgi:hypothetical protein